MRDRFEEARALARQGWLIARRRGRGWRDASVHPQAPHVAFVHGFLAAGPVFDPLRAAVHASLGAPTLDITYGPHRDFESIAAELAERVRREVPPGRALAIVGHSLGGLLARWYVQELGGRAVGLVSIATPHGGAPRARRFPGSLARALRPGGRVLRRLGDSAGVPHVSIVGGRDRLVPTASALAIRDAEVHVYDHLGHNGVLFDPAVHARVVQALERFADDAG